MKFKQTQEELNILISVLNSPLEKVTFNTILEQKLSACILREFLTSIMKRSMDLKKLTTITLDKKTLLVLNHVLPQLFPLSPYEQAVMSMLINKINQECLNI